MILLSDVSLTSTGKKTIWGVNLEKVQAGKVQCAHTHKQTRRCLVTLNPVLLPFRTLHPLLPLDPVNTFSPKDLMSSVQTRLWATWYYFCKDSLTTAYPHCVTLSDDPTRKPHVLKMTHLCTDFQWSFCYSDHFASSETSQEAGCLLTHLQWFHRTIVHITQLSLLYFTQKKVL